VWQPATQDETYEIVRRRLFQPLSAEGYRVRDAVVREYVRYYREHRGEFPSEVLEPRYEERMRLAYPIHPELFDRLTMYWFRLTPSAFASSSRRRWRLLGMRTRTRPLYSRSVDGRGISSPCS